jgi:glycosyltransferase involved in cell wall biosynthesis
MPSVVHLAVSGKFAGVERYICDVATETASRGWDVTVVGGHPQHVPAKLGEGVRWEPGATAREALQAIRRFGRSDIYHAHMTKADALAVATRRRHQAPIVSTRHFAAQRGASPVGRILSPWIAAGLTREVAISEFVAGRMERPPDAVILSGVPRSPCLWNAASRVVLVLQRLEAEKDTITALKAWQASRLIEEGWTLRLAGRGAERGRLERWVATEAVPGVTFTGWTDDVAKEFARAGMVLATAPAEPLGLAVLEAMAAGVPVVACASGGHLETVGRLADARMFAPGDFVDAGQALRRLLSDPARSRLSEDGRHRALESFTIEGHVDRLLVEYSAAQGRPMPQRADALTAESR